MKKAIKWFAYTAFIAIVAYTVYLAFDRFVRNPAESVDDPEDLEDVSYEFDDEAEEGMCCFGEFKKKVRAAADRQISKIS